MVRRGRPVSHRRIIRIAGVTRRASLVVEGGSMKLGVIVPQGWTGEYDGWGSLPAWRRTVAVAQQAERLGAESIWLFDQG
jgi:hypothetical protein